jgi:hypothetical protein
MSHVVTVSLIIKDLDCLEEACKELGLEFKKNQKNYRWFGVWVNDYHDQDAAYKNNVSVENYGKCEHAITCKNWEYDIGLVKEGDGYKLIYDFFGPGRAIKEKLGNNCEKLKMSYAKHVALKSLKKLKSQGFSVKVTENKETNKIHISCRRMK